MRVSTTEALTFPFDYAYILSALFLFLPERHTMISRVWRPCGLIVLLFSLLSCLAVGEQGPNPGTQPAATVMPSVINVPAGAQASANFDPAVATNAYLAEIPARAQARSDPYFEGGYWLILCEFA